MFGFLKVQTYTLVLSDPGLYLDTMWSWLEFGYVTQIECISGLKHNHAVDPSEKNTKKTNQSKHLLYTEKGLTAKVPS